MSEALWAQIISGFFGLATMVLSALLPRRLHRGKPEPTDTPAEKPGEAGP